MRQRAAAAVLTAHLTAYSVFLLSCHSLSGICPGTFEQYRCPLNWEWPEAADIGLPHTLAGSYTVSFWDILLLLLLLLLPFASATQSYVRQVAAQKQVHHHHQTLSGTVQQSGTVKQQPGTGQLMPWLRSQITKIA